jgi:pimeloyl-ACP methyl ester carboxylesterase
VILPHDEQGSGPPVVLLHAGVADRRMWAPLLAPLAAAGLRAVALDLPGFGQAAVGPPPSAPWEDVLETLDALELDSVVLAGNSFGALVAKRLAVVAPDRIAALALISAPPEEWDGEPSPALSAVWDAEEEALERGDIEAAVAAIVAAWTLPDAPAGQRELVADMQRRAFAVQSAADELPDAPDPLEADPGALARFDAPTVVVAGEHDMRDFHEAAAELGAELPRARLQIIAGAGHLAPLEQPEAVRLLLLELASAAHGPEFPT